MSLLHHLSSDLPACYEAIDKKYYQKTNIIKMQSALKQDLEV